MRSLSSILIVISSLLLGCSTGTRDLSRASNAASISVEDRSDQTFLGNCNDLRESDGFRQNIWLNFNKGGHGAICMDLNRHLYLVVDTERSIRSAASLSERLRNLEISATELRTRMDPDAFILDREGIAWISRIPSDAQESFAADFFNDLLGLDLKPDDIRFGWD